MKRFLFLLVLIPTILIADAVIFSGNDVKALKQNLDLFGVVKIQSGTGDPTGAVQSNEGSLFMSVTDGLFRKIGPLITDWVEIVDSGDLALKLDKMYTQNIIEDNGGGGQNSISEVYQFRQNQNSPNEQWNLTTKTVDVDPDLTGFSMGTAGDFATLNNYYFRHQGLSDIGRFTFFNLGADVGNGTDPITVGGLNYFNVFGHLYSGVTLTGQFNGYGFQPLIDSGATLSGGVNAFYDNSQISTSVNGHTSYSSNPVITQINNNSGYTALNVNPSITTFDGNAGSTGIAVAGSYGTFDTGGFQGISINPTITSVNSATGLNVDMSNVTAITDKKAIQTNGDVSINGRTDVNGQLNAFTSFTAIDGGGNPSSVHATISGLQTVPNTTVANSDTFGLNTAMLITTDTNSVSQSGPLGIGFTALGLPAVLETKTGSDTDNVGGAIFAISMSGASTGGHVSQMTGGRFLAIPNGITTVDRYYGGQFDLPFGVVATDNWGIYSNGPEKNYLEGALKIGGTDVPTAGFELDVDGDINADSITTSNSNTFNGNDNHNGNDIFTGQIDFQGIVEFTQQTPNFYAGFRLYDPLGTGYQVQFNQSASQTQDVFYTLPVDDGSSGQYLQTNGSGVLSWQTIPASGDVTGPGSSTDNAIARFDGTTGKIIQNSGASVDDSGNITATNLSGTNTGDQTITLTGDVTGSGTGSLAATIANLSVTNAKIANSTIDLTTKVTGTLPVANGGTGASTLTANNVILGNGTSAVQFVAPGTSGNVLTSNGTTWTSSAPTSPTRCGVVLQDQKTLGTNGGSSSSTPTQRVLNTEVYDNCNLVSLVSNRFTPASGTYKIFASAPAYNADWHSIRLRNHTGSGVPSGCYGTSNYADKANEVQTRALLACYFTANGTDEYEIQHVVANAVASNGLGVRDSTGVGAGTEVYLEVNLEKQ